MKRSLGLFLAVAAVLTALVVLIGNLATVRGWFRDAWQVQRTEQQAARLRDEVEGFLAFGQIGQARGAVRKVHASVPDTVTLNANADFKLTGLLLPFLNQVELRYICAQIGLTHDDGVLAVMNSSYSYGGAEASKSTAAKSQNQTLGRIIRTAP